jgi:2-oxo-4-hydroxy-4-carboxy--5-ureidoimidazoline (OHCU) decarboxylase
VDEGSTRGGAGSTDERAFEPDRLDEASFADLVAPLFERAPRFIARLAAHRPHGSWTALFDRAVPLALEMPLEAQLELIDAHPRIGAPPGSVSAHSYIEQGYDRESAAVGAEAERTRIAAELDQLNATYEARFGFRYVVYVAGRSRVQIVPLLRASLEAEAGAERERAIRDVVAIARDRAVRSGLMVDGVGRMDDAPAPGPWSAAATEREEARP